MKYKRFLRILRWLIICGILLSVFCNLYINSYSAEFLHSDTTDLPKVKYGLVLGTSPYLIGGGENLYFKERIASAVKLYQSGHIKYIIVSGDTSDKYYNEPERMTKALLLKGVPENVILQDVKGTNTILSVKNYGKRFHNDPVIIITQKFHNQRAVFIARKWNIKALGYNTKKQSFSTDPKTHIREWLAKVKAFFEIQIL
ncbi:SanA/YdcF family protein [Sinomicrobium weinanense]|uniref:YdcF family protein n=1 Tax=Sinomicrobium weinanense TaxID=2842200 RepID=A0A926JU20_9FLAO|nr:ElyC/SanA/YdcF family protein [Sinomicrobium weinanense]MBC9797253.1 YdcF family protein [Sinomicrobium weinanense]MBU3122345.1 YdcF family protein [Sinomicrobium weinanense]